MVTRADSASDDLLNETTYSTKGAPVTDGESIEDQLNELRARIIEIAELTQYNLLTGEALGGA